MISKLLCRVLRGCYPGYPGDLLLERVINVKYSNNFKILLCVAKKKKEMSLKERNISNLKKNDLKNWKN